MALSSTDRPPFVVGFAPKPPVRMDRESPEFMYHGTNRENLAGIAEDGFVNVFRPWHGTDQEVWPDGATEKRSYWTPRIETTQYFHPAEGDPVVIRVRHDPKFFRPESGTGDYFSRKKIPAHMVEVQEGDSWVPLNEGGGESPERSRRYERAFAPARMAESKPHVTETPEFKKWFGESKVVDEAGKPRVVYHGTRKAGFDQFDEGMAGENTGRNIRGIYFTQSPLGASTYSNTKKEAEILPEDHEEDDRSPGNYPVYLRMENPYEIDFEGRGFDGSGPSDHDDWLHIDHAVKDAIRGGHDGVIAHNIIDEGRYGQGYGWDNKTYIVFHPHQIKHATQNEGTFDSEDPRMTKSRYARAFSPSRLAAEPDPDRYEDLGSEEKHHERIAENPDSAAAYLDYAHFLESEGKEQTADLIRQWVDQQQKKYGLKNLPDFIPRAPLIDMGKSQPDGREHFVSGNIPGKVTMSIPSEVKGGHHLFFDVDVPKDQARLITSKLEDEGSHDMTLRSDKATLPGRDKFGRIAFDPKKWDELLLEAAKKDYGKAKEGDPIDPVLAKYMEETGHPMAPIFQHAGQKPPKGYGGRPRNIAAIAPAMWNGKNYISVGPRSGRITIQAANHYGAEDDPPSHYIVAADLKPIGGDLGNHGVYRQYNVLPEQMPEIADALHHAGDPIHAHVAKHFPHLYPGGFQPGGETGLDMDEDFTDGGKLTARGEKKLENPLAKFARAFRLSREDDDGEPKKKYGYVGINLTGELADQIRDLAAQIPDDDLAEDGREENPHVTVRYGFHDEVTPEDVAAILGNSGPVAAKVSGLDVFRNDDADVLFAKVDSPDLRRLHESLERLPHTDTHDEYHPHATIAYLKPGLADKYLSSLKSPKGSATANAAVFSDAAKNATDIPFSEASNKFARAFAPARLSLPTLGQPRRGKTHLGETVFHHPFHDESGAELGHVSVIPRGDTLHVHWIGMKGAGADQRPEEAIGTEGVRSLTKQLASAYPEQREIAGHRISGANAGRRVRMPLRKMASAFGPAKLSREDHAAMMAGIGYDQVGKAPKDYDHTGPLVMADFIEENGHPATADYIRRSHQWTPHPDDIYDKHLEGEWGHEGYMEFGDDLGPDTGLAPMQLHYSTYTFPTGEKGFHFGPMLGFPGLIHRESLGKQVPRVGGTMYSVGRDLFDKLRSEATSHVVQGDDETGDNVGGHGDDMAEADGVIDRFFGSTPERKMCGKPSRKARFREALRRLAKNMVSDEGAFHAAINAGGADPLPSLVYADWLEEHDRPAVAKSIRLAVQSAEERSKTPGQFYNVDSNKVTGRSLAARQDRPYHKGNGAYRIYVPQSRGIGGDPYVYFETRIPNQNDKSKVLHYGGFVDPEVGIQLHKELSAELPMHPESQASVDWLKQNYPEHFEEEKPEQMRRLSASQPQSQDFIAALRQLRSKSQTKLHEVAKDIAKSLSMDPSRTRDALHDGPGGAVPSIAQAVWNAPDKDHVRYAAAWYGLLTRTPSLAVFHAGSSGPDSLYKFRYAGSADDLRKQMDREGLPNRVLLPHKDGYDVLIFDPGKRQREKVAAFAKARRLPVEESVGKGEMHGSSDPTAARADYRKTITKFEQGPKRMARESDRPSTLYHHSPRSNRDSILKHGLLADKDQTSELGQDGVVGSVYLTTDHAPHGSDVYAVDTRGLHVDDDPTSPEDEGHNWHVVYGDIPLDRIKLVNQYEPPEPEKKERFAKAFAPKRCAEGESPEPFVIQPEGGEAPLVQAIHHSDWKDPLPTGVFADYVEEGGRPHLAEFLRHAAYGKGNTTHDGGVVTTVPGKIKDEANPGEFHAYSGYPFGTGSKWIVLHHRPQHDPNRTMFWNVLASPKQLKSFASGLRDDGVIVDKSLDDDIYGNSNLKDE